MYEKETKYILDYAKDKVDDIAILLVENDSFSIKINKQEIESFNKSISKGLSVQVIKDGKTGYSYTEKFDNDTFEFVVDSAIKNSDIIDDEKASKIENFKDIDIELDLFNPELEDVDVNKKIELAKQLEQKALDADKRIVSVPYVGVSNGKSYNKIVNSQGLNKEETVNYAVAYAGVLAASKTDKRMGMDFIITRDIADIDPQKIAEEAVREAIELLDGEDVKGGNYQVVFDKYMMATMLSTFSSIFSAKNVQEGKSLLKDKLDKTIANEKVNIIDNQILKGGMSSARYDSEGYPAQKTVLIENGKLVNYLHNTETAAKDNVKSTGNGARGYKSSLVVSPTNFYLEKGPHKREELFAKGKVIEIVSMQGMHSGANPISGDFSLSAEGFLWEDGERKHSLKSFTVSGNFIDLLKNVVMIADDFKFNMSSYGASSTLISELSISG